MKEKINDEDEDEIQKEKKEKEKKKKKKDDKKEVKNNNIYIILCIIVLLAAIFICKFIFLGKGETKKKDKSFTQTSETNKIEYLILHKPEKELFMSLLHPQSSLYEGIFDDEKVNDCFESLIKFFTDKNIKVITVSKALRENKTALKILARDSLKYEIDKSINRSEIDNKNTFQALIDSKNANIDELSDKQLVNVVLTNPTITLKPSKSNRFAELTSISFKPLGNLAFCRDQQITTPKGIVIGRLNSSQRNEEYKIMEQVFKNLNFKVIGNNLEEYDKDAFLEGGDYFVVNKDLSMLGVGYRTTIKAAEFLMEKNLLGTRYIALIYNEADHTDERSHLDTFFNILNDKYAMVLDFNKLQATTKTTVARKVFLYDNKAKDPNKAIDIANIKDFKYQYGEYKLIKEYSKLNDFLEKDSNTKFKLIKISPEDQKEQMINYLNIGDNTVISNSPKLQEKIKESGVHVEFVNLDPIIKMGGSIRSITQVSRY